MVWRRMCTHQVLKSDRAAAIVSVIVDKRKYMVYGRLAVYIGGVCHQQSYPHDEGK